MFNKIANGAHVYFKIRNHQKVLQALYNLERLKYTIF